MATINELISAIASRNFELDCIDEQFDGYDFKPGED